MSRLTPSLDLRSKSFLSRFFTFSFAGVLSIVTMLFALLSAPAFILGQDAKKDGDKKEPEKAQTEKAEAKVVPKKVVAGKPMVNSVGMKLAPIEAGEFMMGSTNEFGRFAHEHQHKVALTKPFYIGVYEVTQAEYEKIMGKNPSHFSKTGKGKDTVGDLDTSRFPVENVSWDEAMEFCKKLSALPEEVAANRVYRLPTEAEWEYACRAGTTTVFHFGESLASTQANFDGNHPYLTREDVIKGESPSKLKGPYLKRPTTVGSFEPNALGLYDMHGNIWEWVSDWYSPVYFKNSPAEDPQGSEKGETKVSRGGGWYYFAAGCRSASRYERKPDERRDTDGFRVVCVVAKKARRF